MITIGNNIYKLSLVLVVLSVFVACSDDDINSPINPVLPQQIEFDCDNGFHELNVASDWHVESFPSWAAPMEESGTNKESITLFVETNFDNNIRKGNLIVALSDGSKLNYELTQQSRLSEDNNGQILIKSTDLQQTYGVGYSINVFSSSETDKYTILRNTPVNFRNLIKALEAAGESDALYSQDQYSSRFESVTGNSTSAIANQLSVNAGIEVGVAGFKLSIEAGYSKKTSTNEKRVYALKEIQHIIGSRYMRGGMLHYFAEKGTDVFQPSFKEYCNALKSNPNNKTILKNIVNTYGTHIVTFGSLGCELKLSMEMVVSQNLKEEDIHAALGLSHKAIGSGNVNFNMSSKEKSIASNTTISLITYGGNNVYAPSLGMNFDDFLKIMKSKEKLDEWVAGITNADPSKNSLHLIDLQTMPIYELMPTEAARTALRDYIVGDYQTEVYLAADKNYKGPDLYKISNYPKAGDENKIGSLVIPEIDVEIVTERKKHEWLSKDEPTTVIYSGSIGKVNYDCGFFVGSDTRKPCKFRKKNDAYEIEVFEGLSTGAINELYVDITGDITISPKGSTDYYRTVNFDNWSYDLTDYSKDYIVKDNRSLTGRISGYNIFLEDGVNVTLNGLAVEDGSILCRGNNKIILADRTKNSVINRWTILNGICPPPSHGSLTIEGSGELWVVCHGPVSCIGPCDNGLFSSDKVAVGLAECGDIIINGGEFSLRSFKGTAIGSNASFGANTRCGNIIINGGKIEAYSGEKNAPIGASEFGRCGDIFIGRNVIKVEVWRENAYSGIGLGSIDSICGKVTIQDPSKVFDRLAPD